MKRSVLFFVLAVGLLLPAAASSKSLLPQPQKVQPMPRDAATSPATEKPEATSQNGILASYFLLLAPGF